LSSYLVIEFIVRAKRNKIAAIPAHSLAAPPLHVNHRIYEGIDPSFGFDTCRMALKRGAMTG
jgi:hypothetical protein